MKIQIIKKSSVVRISDDVCPWVVDVPEEKR